MTREKNNYFIPKAIGYPAFIGTLSNIPVSFLSCFTDPKEHLFQRIFQCHCGFFSSETEYCI
jgi:hypothetical protein